MANRPARPSLVKSSWLKRQPKSYSHQFQPNQKVGWNFQEVDSLTRTTVASNRFVETYGPGPFQVKSVIYYRDLGQLVCLPTKLGNVYMHAGWLTLLKGADVRPKRKTHSRRRSGLRRKNIPGKQIVSLVARPRRRLPGTRGNRIVRASKTSSKS